MRREWLLSGGHRIPLLEHEQSETLPARRRMCPTCGRLRDVEAPADPVDEPICAGCGARGRDGFRADYGADDADVPELELVVLCGVSWEREFGV